MTVQEPKQNKNNIYLLDAIQECGLKYYPKLWPKDNWQIIPEPRFQSVDGKIINKESDPKKAEIQEAIQNILDRVKTWVSDGYLKPFIDNNGDLELVPAYYFGSLRLLIEAGGKTFKSCEERHIQDKEIFFDRGNYNECVHSYRHTDPLGIKSKKVRSRIKEPEARRLTQALFKEYKERGEALDRPNFEKNMRDRLHPRVIKAEMLRMLWQENCGPIGRPPSKKS